MSEPSGHGSTNPYAAPKVAAEDVAGIPVEQRLASGGARFGNLIIDGVMVQILSFTLGVIAALSGVDLAGPISYAFGFAAVVIYYIGLELLGGRTIGKLITGTRVVNEQGGTPRFTQILGRTFARFVPFEAFSFLGTPATGWHDTWSGTRVIKVR